VDLAFVREDKAAGVAERGAEELGRQEIVSLAGLRVAWELGVLLRMWGYC
jgi:hypothetical protein